MAPEGTTLTDGANEGDGQVVIVYTEPPAAVTPVTARGAGQVTTTNRQRLNLAVDARTDATGGAVGRVAVSGGPTFASQTLTRITRNGTVVTITGQATDSRGANGPFALRIDDRGPRNDRISLTFAGRTTTGVLTNGDIRTS